MTCNGCVESVRSALEGMPEVDEARIQLEYPQAKIQSDKELNLTHVNNLLKEKGNYRIADIEEQMGSDLFRTEDRGFIDTYRPLLLIISFIIGISAVVQFPFTDFSWMTWMRHFMAGFFIVFSFFKLLNIKGFAKSYAMYDLLAQKWGNWGLVYPFVELILGLAYLTNISPFITNWATVIILGFNSIGVIKSNLDRRKIKCACLGDVFDLPMSEVTIVEDLTMVLMAVLMLVL